MSEDQGWDTMFSRKKDETVFGDSATSRLVDGGVFSVHMKESNQEGGLFKGKKNNIVTGMWYVFILSCLLWWLPIFGQMIAGYIGGRKGGSPFKGVMVAIVPVMILLLIFVGWDAGLFPFLGFVAAVPSAIGNGLASFSPYTAAYLSGMYNSLGALVGSNVSGFLIILIFSYIGGMMAQMNKQEMAQASGGHFFDGFMGMFTGANLGKFADLVAERVIFSLGSINHGSKKLVGKSHPQSGVFGFEDMKKLPSGAGFVPQSPQNMAMQAQPDSAFGFQDYSPQPAYVDLHEEMEPTTPLKEPRKRRRKKKVQEPEELGVSHADVSEDSMVDTWKEHKKRLDATRKERFKKDVTRATKKLYEEKESSRPRGWDKRDALIYNSMGKDITRNAPRNKRKSSIVERAMATDDDIAGKKVKMEEPKIPSPLEEDIEIKPRVKKPVQSYDRL